jgi:GNAT superfamily N-acetyltransferase
VTTRPQPPSVPPPVSLRTATAADVERLARGVVEGVADYASFAPPGWTAPAVEEEAAHLRALLADPDVWCLVAEADGEVAGQVTVLPAARGPRPVGDPGLAHLRNLFVRRDMWGSGLARALLAAAVDAARERGFARMRLFVAAGQARARRFYEREGWAPAGAAFHDPGPGLEIVEYRRAVDDRRP